MTREEILQSMIADYRRKIETYQTMIGEWEREMGSSSFTPAPASNAGGTSPKGSSGAGGGEELLSVVRDYQFFGKSQPDAAKLLLEMVGHPLRTGVILAGVEKGGVKIGGKTEKERKQNFYTILQRSSDLVRVARDTWGVVGWPGVSKKSATVKEDDGTGEAETEEIKV